METSQPGQAGFRVKLKKGSLVCAYSHPSHSWPQTTTCGSASGTAAAHRIYTLSVYLLIISYFCYRRQLSLEEAGRGQGLGDRGSGGIRGSTGASQRPGVLLSFEGYSRGSLSPPGSVGTKTLAGAARDGHTAVATCFPCLAPQQLGIFVGSNERGHGGASHIPHHMCVHTYTHTHTHTR